jgi:hypothetical protein
VAKMPVRASSGRAVLDVRLTVAVSHAARSTNRRTAPVSDDNLSARWQRALATRIVLQAFRDLRGGGSSEHRDSARAFLAGSAMLRYWCHVGALDLWAIERAAIKMNS